MTVVLADSLSGHVVVGEFRNDTEMDMHLYLEIICEEVVLSSGHEIALLAKADPELLPLTIGVVDDGLQIHAHRVADPAWHIRFKDKLIRPGYPTKLCDYE